MPFYLLLVHFFDELVKSRKIPFFVILSRIVVRDDDQAGIQFFNWLQSFWTPVFTGVTTFYDTIFLGGKNA
jgi:hypothetical protein